MKRILSGKVYDTETATRVAGRVFSEPSDFRYEEATLYKSPHGQFFVAGSGGAKSSYARQVGSNQWTGGEGMVLMTPEEALEWCERFVEDVDRVSAFFDLPEG